MILRLDFAEIYEAKISEMRAAKILDVPKAYLRISVGRPEMNYFFFETDERNTWASLSFENLSPYIDIIELLNVFWNSNKVEWRKNFRKIKPNE